MTRTLGIIGSGNIGAAVARTAVDAGLDVVLSNSRGPETLADLVAELGPHASAATAAEAALASDVVLVSVPLAAFDKLPAEALAGKTVLDTANYYPQRDGRLPELDDRVLTCSGLLQRHLPGARVVKAFNNITPRPILDLRRPAGAEDRSALPIAGDSDAAKAEAADLLDVLGFDAVDFGALAESWRSEPSTPVYVTPYLGGEIPALDLAGFLAWMGERASVPVGAKEVTALIESAQRQDPAATRLPFTG
jgi:predicted dinucleotide-binding enzyme